MQNWKDAVLQQTHSIKEALRVIDSVGIQAVFVVDDNGLLVGIVTDADVRRGLLKGIRLESSVREIMNPQPKVAQEGTSREGILNLMRKDILRQVPVVDKEGRLVCVEIMDDYLKPKRHDNAVVLMAGGLGKRLHPLTLDCPKPLLKVGNKPLLEIILENFIKRGFRRFFLSVFFKAEMVEDYFGDGSRWGVEIQYLKETTQLGTAGCLSLLPKQELPVIVMNGDLLTTVNFEGLVDFHTGRQSTATMCVRSYHHEVPFGVVTVADHSVTKIEEKPSYSFFVNGGIYVLNPEALNLIPRDRSFDMPELLNELIAKNLSVSAFPVREYWLDIGRASDLERAMGDVNELLSTE